VDLAKWAGPDSNQRPRDNASGLRLNHVVGSIDVRAHGGARARIGAVGADYDSFQDSCRVIERLFELGAEGGRLDPNEDQARWQALVKDGRGLFSHDVELVTRDGTMRGPRRLFSDVEAMTRRFTLAFEDLQLIDVGDGRVVALYGFVRKAREGPDYMKTWPAMVFGVREGRIVFLEGYYERAQALRDLGLDPSRPHQTPP
jgi:ketosteroid isomerase-like protein